MSNRNNKKTNKTKNLELDVREKELEYEAIKEAIEKGNMEILSNFNMKNLKTSKNVTKVPKKLSEKEKEKRDEIRRLKEAEDLAQIQQKLFRQVKGRKKIEPLYKKPLYSNMDVFGSNIEKECEKVFPKEEKNKKIEMLRSENVVLKNKNYTHNNNNNNNAAVDKSNLLERKSASKKFKINCDKSNEIDEVKDKEYLDKLDKEIRSFYIEKCGKIFNFLKDIYLCRYIDEFLKQGYDLYEEFIEIPDDFFQQMSVPFLNKTQQDKFYNKLHTIQNKYKQKKISQNYRINQNKNKVNLSNNNNKNNINFNGDENNVNNNIYLNDNTNYKDINDINNNIYINDNNINNTKNTNINDIKNNNNIINNTSNNINKNGLYDINKNENKDNESIHIHKEDEKINNNKNIIKDTSSKISQEELMFKTSAFIDELEKQRAEEFKKAVENWRSKKPSRPNTSYAMNNNKMTAEMGININRPIQNNNNKLYCWNCYKKFLKGEGVSKEYNNNYELNEKYNNKDFCSLKCIKEYEKKQKSQYMCFECRKMFDIMQGFIAFEGEKFCSASCKNKYVQEEKENAKKKNKSKIEEKHKINKENKENNNNKEKNEKNNENEEDYEDSYDPMDDF